MSAGIVEFALLTDARYVAPAAEGDWYLENILEEDRILGDALTARGCRFERVDWAMAGVDWSRYRRAVFRTTWDYFDRFEEFQAWLDRIALATELVNAESLVRWNLDKRYLLHLERKGIPIVPTAAVDVGGALGLDAVLEAQSWTEAVIKPAVSGAGRETHRVHRGNAVDAERFAALVAAECMLVQPFQKSILERGEVTLVVIDGHVTHGVRKVAKPGEFRVQDDHGGRVEPHVPTEAQVALAQRAIAACPTPPVYGRVDLVRGDDGRELVMELELVEPELFLRFRPEAGDRLAEALVAGLKRGARPRVVVGQ